ncbi:MAG: hypothetical protein JJE44_14445 [Flavobacteriaceae bacterium]|nr:hypothetical protein [Flavobacteriaceae bacterium]
MYFKYHLYSEQFDANRNEMIQRVINASVSRFFVPAIDLTNSDGMLELEKSFPERLNILMACDGNLI